MTFLEFLREHGLVLDFQYRSRYEGWDGRMIVSIRGYVLYEAGFEEDASGWGLTEEAALDSLLQRMRGKTLRWVGAASFVKEIEVPEGLRV